MRLNSENTYLFYDIDRHGTIHNQAPQMLVNEFTLLCRFKPDMSYAIGKLNRERQQDPNSNPYLKQCIVGKNGKHMGLFFTSYFDNHGNLLHCVEYEWWQNPLWEQNHSMDDDECKNIQIYINPDDYKHFDVRVVKDSDSFRIELKGHKDFPDVVHHKEMKYDCIIDYSKSLMWMGAANRLLDDTEHYNESFACVYTGDIHLLHVQEEPLTTKEEELFFKDFKAFQDLKINAIENVVYCSTDFRHTTPYKVRDYSGNGLHPLLFNREWIG